MEFATFIESIPGTTHPCEDPWFWDTLRQYRIGDEDARLAILGSCLPITCRLVAESWSETSAISQLDLWQEANVVLDSCLRNFSGFSAKEFCAFVETESRKRVALLQYHPYPPDPLSGE